MTFYPTEKMGTDIYVPALKPLNVQVTHLMLQCLHAMNLTRKRIVRSFAFCCRKDWSKSMPSILNIGQTAVIKCILYLQPIKAT